MRFILTLATIALLVCNALAQNQPMVNLRFVSFPLVANPEPIELLIGHEKTIEVELPGNSISQSYSVPSLQSWSLGKSGVDVNEKFTFNTFGSTESLGTIEQMILVVRQGSDDAEGLRLIPFKSDEGGFDGGKYLLLNATNVEIAGEIGTANFALRPMQHGLIAPKPTRIQDARQYAFARFFFRYQEDVQPFFSSTWRFNERARTMVFFYHDHRTKQLRVHTIRSAGP
jgi:hypothetical protein